MTCKAIIFDLDNTIYPVHTIADQLFSSLFQLLDESGEAKDNLHKIKEDVKRKPFQWVAAQYGLSDELTGKGIQILKNLSINGPIEPFEDYSETKKFHLLKFLVTSGFTKLQQSKVQKMGLEKDFEEIHVVDPETTSKTKKDIFREILERWNIRPYEVLVVGDDPESEIKAAQELGIKAVLYDKLNRYKQSDGLSRIIDFRELSNFLQS